jgi:hypothetical protein
LISSSPPVVGQSLTSELIGLYKAFLKALSEDGGGGLLLQKYLLLEFIGGHIRSRAKSSGGESPSLNTAI